MHHGEARRPLQHVKVVAQGSVGRTKALLKFAVTEARMVLERGQDSPAKGVCGVVHWAGTCDAAHGQTEGSSGSKSAAAQPCQARGAHRQTGGEPWALTHPLLEQRHDENGGPILSEGSLQVRLQREVRSAPDRIFR